MLEPPANGIQSSLWVFCLVSKDSVVCSVEASTCCQGSEVY